VKRKIKLQGSVWLSDPVLHKSVIAEYIRKAEEAGFESLYFTWKPNSSETQVSFTIKL
jgi:hypothetical protein